MTTPTGIGFLSADYLTEMENLSSANLPAIPHVNVRVQFHVTDTPEGIVEYHLVIEKGVIVKASRGRAQETEITITTSYGDLLDFQAGRLHAANAFVSGQFAVAGDKAKLLDLMMVFQSGNYHQFVADLWSRTTW